MMPAMSAAAFPLAFIGPIGPWEAALVLFVGLMLFGKRLPEVGKQVGRTVADLRRKFQDFKRELNSDEALREARRAVDGFRRDIESPRETMRSLSNPVQVFDRLTREDHATPGPGAIAETPTGGSFLGAVPPPENGDHGSGAPPDRP